MSTLNEANISLLLSWAVIYTVWVVSGREVKGLIDKTLYYYNPSVLNQTESLSRIKGGLPYGYRSS
jgi:hypothetical protein